MSNKGRTFAILGLAVVILGGAAVAFRFETQRKPTPPLIGVVHETEIRIAPDISARLASLSVKPLQSVRKGDVIAVLSSPEVAASLEEAKANAESARANLANVVAGVRQEERDTAAQNVAIAASNVTLAKQQFARVSVLAAKNYASKQQFDEDAAALGEAQASLCSRRGGFSPEQGWTDQGRARHRAETGCPRPGDGRRPRGSTRQDDADIAC